MAVPDRSAYDRVEYLLEVRRFEQARAAAQLLVAAEPTHSSALHLLTRACLGGSDPQSALASAQRAVALDPESAYAYRLLSLALGSCRHVDDAVAAARRSVVLAPLVPEGHHILALAQLEVGQPVAARDAAQRAAELAPNDAVILCTLGRVLRRCGDVKGSDAQYYRALAVDPINVAARQALAVRQLHGGAHFGRTKALAASTSSFVGLVAEHPVGAAAEVSRFNALAAVRSTVMHFFQRVQLAAMLAMVCSGRTPVASIATALLVCIVAWSFVVGYVIRLSEPARRWVFQVRHLALDLKTSLSGVAAVLILSVVAACAPSTLRQGIEAAIFVGCALGLLIERSIATNRRRTFLEGR